MRTGRSLTVCCSLLPGGVCSRGGCPVQGGAWSAPGGRGWQCLVWGCLLWGVGSATGGLSAPRGGLLPRGGAWSGGVSALGGSAPGGYPSMHWGRHTPPLWTERRLWKYYLGPTSLRPVMTMWTISPSEPAPCTLHPAHYYPHTLYPSYPPTHIMHPSHPAHNTHLHTEKWLFAPSSNFKYSNIQYPIPSNHCLLWPKAFLHLVTIS